MGNTCCPTTLTIYYVLLSLTVINRWMFYHQVYVYCSLCFVRSKIRFNHKNIPPQTISHSNVSRVLLTITHILRIIPDSKVHGANMRPTWVLSAPEGPNVGPMDLAIRDGLISGHIANSCRKSGLNHSLTGNEANVVASFLSHENKWFMSLKLFQLLHVKIKSSEFPIFIVYIARGVQSAHTLSQNSVAIQAFSINTLWPSNAIWLHRTWSTLVRVIACCLTLQAITRMLTNH